MVVTHNRDYNIMREITSKSKINKNRIPSVNKNVERAKAIEIYGKYGKSN